MFRKARQERPPEATHTIPPESSIFSLEPGQEIEITIRGVTKKIKRDGDIFYFEMPTDYSKGHIEAPPTTTVKLSLQDPTSTGEKMTIARNIVDAISTLSTK